jgi:hypothetical protein
VGNEDDLLPKKKTSSTAKPVKASSGSAASRKLTAYVRLAGIALGGVVTLVGMMSVVGLVTDNLWARLGVALVLVVGFPAFVSDRILKRTGGKAGVGRVADIFAISLLALALLLVAAPLVSRPLFVREGDGYARAGSRTMARVAYFLGGVSPVWPEERDAGAAPPGSASPTKPDAGEEKR